MNSQENPPKKSRDESRTALKLLRRVNVDILRFLLY